MHSLIPLVLGISDMQSHTGGHFKQLEVEPVWWMDVSVVVSVVRYYVQF